MGKINITLNGKTYSVDSSLIAETLAKLEMYVESIANTQLAPGLYQTGAIALYQAGDTEAAEVMIVTPWEVLETNGVIAISKGVEIPDDYVMNEYGFYFGKPYSVVMGGEFVKLTFNEDGSGIMNQNGEITAIPAGAFIYGDHSIDMSSTLGLIFTVSVDGASLEAGGVVFSLQILDLPEMNEYGFYFGTFYSTIWDGITVGFTFNEDGSVIVNSGNEISESPAGAAVYGDHSIDMTAVGGSVITVSPDGTMMVLEGSILSVGSSGVPPKGTVYLPNQTLIEGDLVLPNDGAAIIIPAGIFAEQISLTGVLISDSITKIGYNAFYNCESLASVVIGNSAAILGSGAFDNTAYYNNESSWIDKVLYVGNTLYKAKTNLSGDYIIRDDTFAIADEAFMDCESLTSVIIPDSVTFIGAAAFYRCSSLTSIAIPDGVTSIERSTFQICESLTSVIIPDSVTSINYEAFVGCSGLTDIVIPNSVTFIDQGAFQSCTSLNNITFNGTISQWNAIEKVSSWNSYTPATHVQCSDGQVAIN